MITAGTIWKFSRPHTVIGSMISIFCLYMVAASNSPEVFPQILYFLLVLASALLCNLFITGYNQICDVSIDKINKAYLPLPSGELSLKNARAIVWTSLIISLALAWIIDIYLFYLIALIALIGFAYSSEFFFFKKHHLSAALSIAAVRGILINLGFYYIFSRNLNGIADLPFIIIVFSIHIVLFSIGIAWFKDMPDRVGDKAHHIQTLVIKINPKRTLLLGVFIVTAGFVLIIGAGFFAEKQFNADFMQWSHGVLLLMFLLSTLKLDIESPVSIRRFYLFYWFLFFMEYIIFTLAFYI